MAKAAPKAYFDTLPPDAISDELAPTIDELGLRENCRELAMNGWTVVRDVASAEFNERFRQTILNLNAEKTWFQYAPCEGSNLR